MNREILTYPLTEDQFWGEFKHFVEYAIDAGQSECQFMLGNAWGMHYYGDKDWDFETIETKELESKIRLVEEKSNETFGQNDLFVKIFGVEFQFCNDTDIHIRFQKNNSFVEYFYKRWTDLKYNPAEWMEDKNRITIKWIRGTKPKE